MRGRDRLEDKPDQLLLLFLRLSICRLFQGVDAEIMLVFCFPFRRKFSNSSRRYVISARRHCATLGIVRICLSGVVPDFWKFWSMRPSNTVARIDILPRVVGMCQLLELIGPESQSSGDALAMALSACFVDIVIE
jgi:hypothetical protein